MRDDGASRRPWKDRWMEHLRATDAAASSDIARFFCYCCGQHEWNTFCPCCHGRACARCLEFEAPCPDIGDTWCRNMHVAYHECPHVGPRDARSTYPTTVC